MVFRVALLVVLNVALLHVLCVALLLRHVLALHLGHVNGLGHLYEGALPVLLLVALLFLDGGAILAVNILNLIKSVI